jgi:hypothetical protein
MAVVQIGEQAGLWSSDRFEARADPAVIDPSSFRQPRPQASKHVAFGLTTLAGAG